MGDPDNIFVLSRYFAECRAELPRGLPEGGPHHAEILMNPIMCRSRGGRGMGSGSLLKNHKHIGFSSNTGPDPLKNRSHQASIQ